MMTIEQLERSARGYKTASDLGEAVRKLARSGMLAHDLLGGFVQGVCDRDAYVDMSDAYHGDKYHGYVVGWSIMDDKMKEEGSC